MRVSQPSVEQEAEGQKLIVGSLRQQLLVLGAVGFVEGTIDWRSWWFLCTVKATAVN